MIDVSFFCCKVTDIILYIQEKSNKFNIYVFIYIYKITFFQSETYVRAIKIFFVTLHRRNLRAFLARNGIGKLKNLREKTRCSRVKPSMVPQWYLNGTSVIPRKGIESSSRSTPPFTQISTFSISRKKADKLFFQTQEKNLLLLRRK